MEKEKELKDLVQQEFNNAITEANIKSVMSLCPLLQTLGLEAEARDSFLQFVETSVFIAVSADASAVDGATGFILIKLFYLFILNQIYFILIILNEQMPPRDMLKLFPMFSTRLI